MVGRMAAVRAEMMDAQTVGLKVYMTAALKVELMVGELENKMADEKES